MKTPNRVRIALQFIGMCHCAESGWEGHVQLSPEEEQVKRTALNYLDNYLKGEFFDEDESIEIQQGKPEVKKVRKSARKKGI